MPRRQELPERARRLVEEWPPGGLVVGLLPDPSDPEWAGRAALALALAVADRRKPPLILDLTPVGTDLSSRFGATGEEAGIAELVDGEAELWEIVHRHASGEAFYLPCGLRTPGAELARSPTTASLADRVRRGGRIALAPLDRRGAGEAASAGWIDGYVRLGEMGVSSVRLSGDAGAVGHLERRGGGGGAATAGEPGAGPGPSGSGERETTVRRGSGGRQREEPRPDREERAPERGGSTDGLALRRRRGSRAVLRRAGRVLIVAALVIAVGVTASAWLGGPGWGEVGDAAGTVTGQVEDAVPAGPDAPGTAADSAPESGADPGGPAAADSAAPAAGDTADR